MPDSSSHQYLYENLVILNELKPGGPDFVKCIKDDMFTKPNRIAFDQVLFYLCSAYDSARYLAKVPWPILDRSQERAFRQNSVTFVKEIIKNLPEARIPQFSPSFLSTPGGERLAKFMWKFSLLVLKTLVEREGDAIGLFQYPSAPAVLPLVEYVTESILQDIGKESNDLCQLIIDASQHAKKMSNEILNLSMENNRLKSELTDIIQSMTNCPLPEKDKSLLLTCDRKQFLSITSHWQKHLNKEAIEGESMLENLKDQSNVIIDCYNSVQALVNSKTMPVVLDASDFPSNLKDNSGNVDLAQLLSEGAFIASNLLKSLSMFGGFQCYGLVLPELESLRKQLQEAQNYFAETKAGFVGLLSASLESKRLPKNINDETESPVMRGGLQLGNEMLKDVQTNTPPMVFDVRCDMWSRISTESSPIGRVRPLPRLKANVESSTTPNAALSKSSSGLVSGNLSGRVSQLKSFSQKYQKFLKGSPKLNGHEAMSAVLETPANFCPKNFSTSTACKPTLVPPSSKSKLDFSSQLSDSHSLDGKNLKTVKEFSSSKSTDIRSGVQRIISTKTVFAQCPTSIPEEKECNPNFLKKKEKSVEMLLIGPVAKEESFKKIGTQCNFKNTVVPSTKQTTKKELFSLSPVTKKDESGGVTSSLNPASTLKTSKVVASVTFSSPLHKTPVGSKPVSTKKSDSSSDVPKVVVSATGESFCETFDSPQSSSLGGFSPPSANDSFFSTDIQTDIAIGEQSKLNLDAFVDDISPSGRVSLCPPDVEANEIIKEEPAPAKNSSRRKSLQAIIHRYRELVASSKQNTVVPPSSPEVQATDEDFLEDFETGFNDLNVL